MRDMVKQQSSLELRPGEEAELPLRFQAELASTCCSKRQSQQLLPGQVP